MIFSDPLLQIGSFPIYVFGLVLALTFVLSVFLFWRAATREGFASDSVFDLIFVAVFSGFLFGRVSYLGLNGSLKVLWGDPLALVRVGEGVYWAGAFTGGLTVFYLFVRRQSRRAGWSFLKLADLAAPIMTLAQGLGFFAAGITGYITFTVTDHPVHPLVYVVAAYAILFAVLELIKKKPRVSGFVFLFYLIFSGLITYLLAFIKTTSVYAFGIDINALLGILLVIGGVLGFLRVYRKRIGTFFEPLRRRLRSLPIFGRVEKQLKFELKMGRPFLIKSSKARRGHGQEKVAGGETMLKNVCKLPANFLKKVKSFLESEEERLAKEKEKLEKEDPFRVPGRDVGNPEMLEEAAEKIGHEQVEAQKGIFNRLLIDTRWALSKLKLGKYGLCDKCHKCIDRARLQAFPQARRCVECDKEVREREEAMASSEG